MHSLISTHYISVTHKEWKLKAEINLTREDTFDNVGDVINMTEKDIMSRHIILNRTQQWMTYLSFAACAILWARQRREVIRQTSQNGGGKPKTAREGT